MALGKVEAIVETAEGDVIRFSGVVARFIVSHPRASTALALIAGLVIGHLI